MYISECIIITLILLLCRFFQRHRVQRLEELVLLVLLILTSVAVSPALAADDLIESAYGYISAQLPNDVVIYHIEISQPGRLLLVLETEEQNSELGIRVDVVDKMGQSQIDNIQFIKNQEIIYIDVEPNDFYEDTILEYEIDLIAMFGEGNYHLSVFRPEEMRTEYVFGDVAYFDVIVTGEEMPPFFWNTVASDEMEISSVEIYAWDKISKVPIPLNSPIYYQSCLPGKLEWDFLPPGHYTIGVKKTGYGKRLWELTWAIADNLHSVLQNFTSGTILEGESDIFQLKIEGGEMWLWISSDPLPDASDGSMMQVQMADAAGNGMNLKSLIVNNTTLIPVNTLPAGTYQLTLTSTEKRNYEIGMEYADHFAVPNIKLYQQQFTFIPGQRISFDSGSAVLPDLTITNLSFSDTAHLRIGQNEDGEVLRNVSIPPGDVYTLTGVSGSTPQFWIENSGSPVQCVLARPVVVMDRKEANDQRINATPITGMSVLTGNISSLTDVDYYTFETDTVMRIKLNLSMIPLECDYNLSLLDPMGNVVVSSDNPGRKDELIEGWIQPGVYFVKIDSKSGFSNAHYTLLNLLKPYTYSGTILVEEED